VANDVMDDKLGNLLASGVSEWNGFDPFSEILSGDNDELVAIRGGWVNLANKM